MQILKFTTYETKLLKMPHFETACFQMETRVTVASVNVGQMYESFFGE